MSALRSGQTTQDHGKTLQDILDTLTRPQKWIPEPVTVTTSDSLVTDKSNLHLDATWTGAGHEIAMNGSSVIGHTNTGAAPQTEPVGITVTTSLLETLSPLTLPDAPSASDDFWYRYGVSITVAVLVIAVAIVLAIQCKILYQKNIGHRRRLVDLAGNRSNKAREDVFESFHRQETAKASMSGRLQTVSSTQEDIPLRVFHENQPCHLPWRAPPAGRAAEPLARVYPIHQGASGARDLNANITDPSQCDSDCRLWNTTAGVYPVRTHRTVSSEPVIARPTPSRRYSSRPKNRIRRGLRVKGTSGPRMARFNISGTRVLTSPDSNGVRHKMQRRNRPARPKIRTTFADMNTPTPKLIVPTNTPCTDSPQENVSQYGPGLDSDFGASAGIPHFTVSPDADNSMNTSVRDITYEWDTYDPGYMNRTVRYVDGAYFPVLQRRQYWV